MTKRQEKKYKEWIAKGYKPAEVNLLMTYPKCLDNLMILFNGQPLRLYVKSVYQNGSREKYMAMLNEAQIPFEIYREDGNCYNDYIFIAKLGIILEIK